MSAVGDDKLDETGEYLVSSPQASFIIPGPAMRTIMRHTLRPLRDSRLSNVLLTSTPVIHDTVPALNSLHSLKGNKFYARRVVRIALGVLNSTIHEFWKGGS